MIDGKKVIALIPARGGSQRLPRKNVLPLNGKPLIGWSIEAALSCNYIDKVLVSTDDQEIADISLSFGANVPELRPEHLASNTAKTESVLNYTIDNFCEGYEIIILLQPTSPLRNSQNITEALEEFIIKQANSVVSVTPCEHSPLWTNKLSENGSMRDFLSSEALQRSQDLESYYRLNGAIYIFDIFDFSNKKTITYTEKTFAYVMDSFSSIDIDNSIDFELAEFFIKKRTV